ncbi:NADP-dependent phosphogluconate dehydrogenase [Corallincola spongiicola]|uniref:6-phosphogluconate dehydrogenase, decarboxylating n=1 Tax=Corallincola spongiicola TaxID=2520508 RepID=A0ABY1WUV9_9GAMM|nr:NADP-dependent phosphogluconate dehydrogenase [Corallincola spongiicola]TAA48467.1 NADP-dependent phosphogluconate dehydrogenase [Corallincola spongiicola]
MSDQQPLCDIGFIGLGVMGKNLVLNLADNGYKVAAFDLDKDKVDAVLAAEASERAEGIEQRVFGCSEMNELVTRVKKPHLFILSVPAGEAVDRVCSALLAAGVGAEDVIIDTGNSLWTDTVRREASYRGQFVFFSTAVSGGEVGARFGPSLMPSGDKKAWAMIEPVLEAISAKVDANSGLPLERTQPGQVITEGEPCATYIGPAGAGHYVKMVHNGIEYADMQLICEAYHLLRDALGMTAKEIGEIFQTWDKGVLNSYLMEISAEVLLQDDPETGAPLVEMILDKAGQKGTGLWTAVSSLEQGTPAPTITQAVFARALSTLKSERVAAAEVLQGPKSEPVSEAEKQAFIESLHDALYCSKICAYAQGFALMASASDEHDWGLDFAAIAKIWRAGCIIRAVFLQSITQAYQAKPKLANLLLDPFFQQQVEQKQMNWRRTVAKATLMGIPCPAFSSAISYFDSYRTAVLPANLLQGQRDFFGAHTFERTDKPSGEKFHLNWSSPARDLTQV